MHKDIRSIYLEFAGGTWVFIPAEYFLQFTVKQGKKPGFPAQVTMVLRKEVEARVRLFAGDFGIETKYDFLWDALQDNSIRNLSIEREDRSSARLEMPWESLDGCGPYEPCMPGETPPRSVLQVLSHTAGGDYRITIGKEG